MRSPARLRGRRREAQARSSALGAVDRGHCIGDLGRAAQDRRLRPRIESFADVGRVAVGLGELSAVGVHVARSLDRDLSRSRVRSRGLSESHTDQDRHHEREREDRHSQRQRGEGVALRPTVVAGREVARVGVEVHVIAPSGVFCVVGRSVLPYTQPALCVKAGWV